jgi:hypothetical protein
MPDSEIRRAVIGNRREGRRSHSAYGSHARGDRPLAARSAAFGGLRVGEARTSLVQRAGAGTWSAASALALVYPLVTRARAPITKDQGNRATSSQPGGSGGTNAMTRKPSVKSLQTVSLEEAHAYLEHAGGDELDAAYALAWDRNRLDGSHAAPDDAEVHHASFLLCRARGKHPPSFDEMRVELRRRVAA